MTIAIIAGGRDYVVGAKQRRWLDGIHAALRITRVYSGGCSGADGGGEAWAISRGIPTRIFTAAWTSHGKAAGPIRNREMAEYAAENVKFGTSQAVCVLFPGGKGTTNMRQEAHRSGLRVIEYEDLEG